MKNLLMPALAIIALSCVSNKSNTQSGAKLEIVSIDSIRDHFVFKTKSEHGREMIILAEKNRVEGCRPFKKFIIQDSVHYVSAIKSGTHHDLVGFNVSMVDGVKIRDSAELVKIIWNCNCFTSH